MASCRATLISFLSLCLLAINTVQGAPMPLDPQADPRLAKKHTLYHPPTPLGELLQAISRQTGVTLRVERSVAQHRAILVAHEQPLHESLNRLAETFGFTWRKVETKGKPVEYMLYQPAQALAQQRAEWGELQRLNQQIVQGALREIVRADVSRLDAMRREYSKRLNELRDTAKAPRNRDEALAMLQQRFLIEASTSWHKWIAAYVLAKLPASAWRRLEAGEVLNFHTAQPDTPIPPNYVTVWKQLEQEAMERPSPFPVDERWRENTRRNVEATDSGRITLFMHPVSRALMFQYAMTEGDFPRMFDNCKPLWYSLADVAYLLDDLLQRSRAREEKPLSPSVQKLSQPLKEVRLSLQEMGDIAGNLLARFARANGVNLVAEWYPYPPTQLYDVVLPRQSEGTLSLEWRPVAQFLKDYGYDMQDSDSFVLVTQRLRTLYRQYDVPETFVRRWLFKRGREGELDMNDVLEIASLLPEQIQTIPNRSDNILAFRRSKNHPPAHLREIVSHPQLQVALLAVGALPPAMRQAVLQGVPIPFGQLPTQAQRLLVLAASFVQPSPVPVGLISYERAALLVRIEERNRLEPPAEIPMGDDALRGIVERFHSTPYEDFLASLSEEERHRYLRPRYLRIVQILLQEGETPYFGADFYWERWEE